MIALDSVGFIGSGLVRPECVLATRAGDLYASDGRGGVSHIRPDGSQALYQGSTADLPEGPRPNGIALEPAGTFLFANLGSELGGVWRLDRSGQIRPVLTEIDGAPLPPTNFVGRDRQGRVWLTVSTRERPRQRDYHAGAGSGFIVLADGRGARIVADGIGYTNECMVDPSDRWLYVVETFARRLSRYPLGSGGDLGAREIVARFGAGDFPDGFAFDRDGGVWIASVISNRLIHVAASGRAAVVLEDADPEHLATVEQAYRGRTMGRAHMDDIRSLKLRSISSIAFGGPDLRTAYLGCLLGDRIATLRMPVPGHPPAHWAFA